jgi:hypothetical protein
MADLMSCPALPSMAGGIQALIAAAQAAMDEAIGRFASYACPCLEETEHRLVGSVRSTSAG